MAKKLYEEASVQAIANAIRAKNGSTATYKVAQMADAVLAIAPLQPDVEEYPQMSTTVAAYLTAAEAAYTDANGGSVSVLGSYTGARTSSCELFRSASRARCRLHPLRCLSRCSGGRARGLRCRSRILLPGYC